MEDNHLMITIKITLSLGRDGRREAHGLPTRCGLAGEGDRGEAFGMFPQVFTCPKNTRG